VKYVVLANIPIFERIGGVILSRWAHFLAGITWIGILYYFNFVQTPSFAEFEAGSRTEATAKLVPRAMWWFRWGAMLTLLSGISILGFQDQFNGDYWKTASGVSISVGILLALVMFSNVWFVIWPAQKRNIANAQNVMGGQPADSGLAPVVRRAALASRTNTLFSIPMLFFMAATSHFAPVHDATSSGKRGAFLGVVLFVTALLEMNALGILGGTDPGPARAYLDKHQNTIIAGFAYAVLLIALFEIFFG
jgi:uncharacterized membrane protein